MSNYIINATGIKKVFKVHKKDKSGLKASIRSLFKREFVHVAAVEGVDLYINKGEIRGLIGPNGAGKSTIIKMLSGILYPSEGKVEVLGYTPWLQREQYVRHIGVVLGQKSQLIWELPAIDTFSLAKEMYKIPENTFKANLDYLVDLLNIQEVIKRPVRQISLGERMRCELVCAMLHEPKLVYLDEPTIGLDILSKEAIRNFIKQINKEKEITFILTTHDLDDIENLCHNVTVINKGKIVFNDSLDRLKSYYSSKKIIELKFSSGISRDLLNDFIIQSFDGLTATVEVDLSTCELQDVILKLFSSLPVLDINISNISIEEVIKHLYQT